MNEEKIRRIIRDIRQVKIAVYGDFCLDAYWIMDPRGSEVSVETGLKAEAVRRHYYTPGGASNVVANIAALQPKYIKIIGVVGDDIFGRDLTAQLSRLATDTSGLYVQQSKFDTYTFTKKYSDEEEEPRIDFGVFNERSADADKFILNKLREVLPMVDVLIFNQQVPGSISNMEFIDEANKVFREHSDKIIFLDSRHFNSRFKHIYRKTNAVEIALMNGVSYGPDDNLPLDKVASFGQNIFRKERKPVFITCGERGLLVIDQQGTHHIPGIQFLKRLDPVGAGDTVISALALSMAAGCNPEEAATFANLAAAVTVQKLFTTGTASAGEIIEEGRNPDFIYHPDLSWNEDQAVYLDRTKIEICSGTIVAGDYKILHAVFDHDGTISLLRTGWEEVMEEMMLQAIMGKNPDGNAQKKKERILSRVKNYINKSTGIQTIRQMEALAEMVSEFGIIEHKNILTPSAYKQIFLDQLMIRIQKKISAVREGERPAEYYIVAGALQFLKTLQQRGIRLYLVSGTDEEYVELEARLLGYASLFDGGIFGARDSLKEDTKKWLMKNIIHENNLKGREIMVVGDGPVEIRECRKRGGLAIGVASDEKNKHGVNQSKRTRLIQAGADLIIPDFQEYTLLMNWMESR